MNVRALSQALLADALGISFPYYSFGNIDTLHLFGLETELPILALYRKNIGRWQKVLDIGANVGLHSIMLAKYGYEVLSYEPDFEHFQHLAENLAANHCASVTPHMAAVHTATGEAHFVRVLNNLTGNHLEGFKSSYGPRETVLVPTVDCRPLFDWADFAKLDCEGNEAELMLTTTPEQMSHLSMIAEVRNTENAARIYKHFTQLGVPMWSQRRDWQRVRTFVDMPCSNRDGSLFVGHGAPFGD